ncbi:TRAP transporter substrate-binding protein [Pandoraea sp. XY-2]|uniref:TRAP transporter substrate-binding protein n=1 Tax=Pandoraea sp. XY-2 TaxID=2518599 RepID=UPI00101B15FF|nr:TRAP transporter substrate-binding protein [Pandoraea sp. XY-2]QBC30845.1 TRAP transporter substrate-binding protein [Pandoraea sp. XY-2]
MSTDSNTKTRINRRTFLKAGAALSVAAPLVSVSGRAFSAPQFSYKLATGQDPSHPVNVRAKQAAERILKATGGRLEIRVFPSNQLGSDTDLLSQIRNGGVEFINMAASVLSTLVPAAGIANTGFAFPDYDHVWKAMDGDLGKYMQAQIGKAGMLAMSRPWDNGFRQITSSTKPIRTPDDLHGFKIRVPVAPMLISLFQSLKAGPTPINFNELYSALQTRLVDGQENPLPIISTAKLYEVQKYVSMTSHVWDAYWILGNPAAFKRLPSDVQAIVLTEFDRAATEERADIAALNSTLSQSLASKGLQIVDADKQAFREQLSKTSFYRDWRAKFGAQGWDLLQQTTGALA